MATFMVCTRCGKTREVTTADELPAGWKRAYTSELLCPSCTNIDVLDPIVTSDVLDEEVIYPFSSGDDTLDEDCEICRGSCQGH